MNFSRIFWVHLQGEKGPDVKDPVYGPNNLYKRRVEFKNVGKQSSQLHRKRTRRETLIGCFSTVGRKLYPSLFGEDWEGIALVGRTRLWI